MDISFQNVDPFFLSSFGCVCCVGSPCWIKKQMVGTSTSFCVAGQPAHKKGAAFEKKEHFILITSFHSLGFWYNGPCCCCQSQRKSIERREHSNGHQVQLPMSCWHTYIQPDPPSLYSWQCPFVCYQFNNFWALASWSIRTSGLNRPSARLFTATAALCRKKKEKMLL